MKKIGLRQKRALWAAGMLVIATAAGLLAYGAATRGTSSGFNPLGSALPGFAVDSADVTEYLITTPDGAYRLTRGKSRWVLMERGGYPAQKDKIESLIAGLVNLKLERVLTEDAEKFEALRLTDPRQGGSGALIQATDAQGDERGTLLIGSSSQGLLVRYPGDNKAYLVHGGLPDLSNPADFADLDALKIGADRVQRIDIVYPSGAALSLERANPDVAFGPAPAKKAKPVAPPPLGSAELAAIALTTTPFHPVDVKEEPNETPAGDPLGERRITTFDGLNVRMIFARKDGALWTLVSAGGGGSSAEAVAINSRTSGWAFAFAPDDLAHLFPLLPGTGGPPKLKGATDAKLEAVAAE
ncbi:MAG: DUF4340 domain-containing protein [Caulobacterales bacterium]